MGRTLAATTAAPGVEPLRVQTSSGIVQGTINSTYPNVQQFLGIPYAKPPMGERRWLPPQELGNHSTTFVNAITMPAACPQSLVAMEKGPFGKYAPQTMVAGNISEDCLTLSVWAPKNGKKNLPVIIWIHGGQYLYGGTNVRPWIPSPWIERSQEHIIVAIQYRLNMFGFPAARGLKDQNLGILDQRLGMEWVRRNIAQFGGNPEQMILWGESAGGSSTDILNFAYPKDPIVQGFACNSGSAFLTVDTRSDDVQGSNFSTVASHFGCAGSAEKEIDCLRSIPAARIISYLGSGGSNLTFLPYVDDKIIFNNYTQQYLRQHLSRKPALFGSNRDEGTLMAGGTDSPQAREITYSKFQCPVPYSTARREELGLTTYRYQYRGNFSNIDALPTLGAYHSSELPLIFGTADDVFGPSTPFEKAVSHKMQDLWVAFAKDPEAGLKRQGWPVSTSDKFLALGSGNISATASDKTIDGPCEEYYSLY
ncbi:carboxylesterase, type B [Aspergillus steynii IBT 23096]|uniref:Carboxylic ester hydrolase n=1 Tax=Aspergillus steynii IBT 23096 TaxID=1392250 RepID=A0A2I2GMQ6_9EURO|nr:carboxylesterase, type B [Aspergillus steynii IBT 23096]PLB54156.1 carboxylesterase, type B [Aspergillus steynii IBT 23096]